jgi:hypothetical protein
MIYFIRCTKTSQIKIGTTLGLAKRLGQLARDRKTTLEVLAVMPGDQTREADLHRQFGHLRMEGEWFDPGMDLVEFIREHGRPWEGPVENPTEPLRSPSPSHTQDLIRSAVRAERARIKAGMEEVGRDMAKVRDDLKVIATRLYDLQRTLEFLASAPDGDLDPYTRKSLKRCLELLDETRKLLPEDERAVRIHEAG